MNTIIIVNKKLFIINVKLTVKGAKVHIEDPFGHISSLIEQEYNMLYERAKKFAETNVGRKLK